MSGNLRHSVLKDGAEVGAFYDLPWHGQVCLHVDDPALSALLVESGVVTSRRAPFLDAVGAGVHGAYRPRVQQNLFFDPPVDAVLAAIRPVLESAGYRVATAEPAR